MRIPKPKTGQFGSQQWNDVLKALTEKSNFLNLISNQSLTVPKSIGMPVDLCFAEFSPVVNGAPTPLMTGVCGKGKSQSEALAKCLLEAAERYCAMYAPRIPTLRTSYSRIAPNAISLQDCSLISEKQYHNRVVWNSGKSRFLQIPDPLPDDVEVDWIEAKRLEDGKAVLIPATFAFCRYSGADSRFYQADTNGCAAALSPEQATESGFLELIERDAVAMWWYNRFQVPELVIGADITSEVRNAREFLRGQGRNLVLLDLPTDFGARVVTAVSATIKNGAEILWGNGCDGNPDVAAQKAIGELFQMYYQYQSYKEAEIKPTCPDWFRDLLLWCETATLEKHRYFIPLPPDKTKPYKPSTHRIGLDYCIQFCREAGMQLLRIDLGLPEVGVPVVRTIVPGLRHAWPRFAPGRLFSIPSLLGVSQAKQEFELNPESFFL